ncbi:MULTISPECIES: TetR family transcriptional regulator [Arthrobacter]|uniref:TetR family transcriptional regulator n=2 Tax=Arthrobacter TaxID=1663 RepID=A0ABU9KHR8_9MICC|nr:TetR family transcriptional regulator [Arthrobacter sp. YJM1]MDP5226563.1 TetR family transcriptional regulator [Arthrobacter sp. YJM1]
MKTDPETAPIASLRERKKQQTRAAIHNAAQDLVLEEGLAQVTIADICARAGISERTFFNYFPSKAAASLGLPDDPLSEARTRAFLESDGAIIDDLCVLIGSLSSGPDSVPKLKQLVVNEPELMAAVHHWTSGLRAEIVGLAEQKTTPLRARAATSLVFAALFLHSDSSHAGIEDRPSADDLRAMVKVLAEVARGR